jgi:HSP20 family protein
MVRRIKPVSRIDSIEKVINKRVGELPYQRKELLGLDEQWSPRLDISERENEIVVEVELPGVAQKDIMLLLHSNRLEIKGVKRENLPRGRICYIRLEREYGTFRRFAFLPEMVIPEKAQASLEKGVLRIQLRKYKKKGERKFILKIQHSRD